MRVLLLFIQKLYKKIEKLVKMAFLDLIRCSFYKRSVIDCYGEVGFIELALAK